MSRALATGIAFATICMACSLTLEQSPLLQHTKAIRISPKFARALYSNRGTMHTVQQCGGQGQLLQWRHEFCERTLYGPCIQQANVTTRGELSFIPRETSDSMGVRMKLLDSSGALLMEQEERDIPDSAATAGLEYALTGGISFGEELKGRVLKGQASIYRESDQEVEVCAEADFIVV